MGGWSSSKKLGKGAGAQRALGTTLGRNWRLLAGRNSPTPFFFFDALVFAGRGYLRSARRWCSIANYVINGRDGSPNHRHRGTTMAKA